MTSSITATSRSSSQRSVPLVHAGSPPPGRLRPERRLGRGRRPAELGTQSPAPEVTPVWWALEPFGAVSAPRVLVSRAYPVGLRVGLGNSGGWGRARSGLRNCRGRAGRGRCAGSLPADVRPACTGPGRRAATWPRKASATSWSWPATEPREPRNSPRSTRSWSPPPTLAYPRVPSPLAAQLRAGRRLVQPVGPAARNMSPCTRRSSTACG